MLVSQRQAAANHIPTSGAARMTAIERRLDAAVAKLLVGTEWLCNGAVWTVQMAIYGEIRVGSGTEVRFYTVGEWLGNPDCKRVACRPLS